MINVNRLKELITERNKTQQIVADEIGIDRSTFYRKMKNGGEFSVKEAQLISDSIPLSNLESIEIFFGEEVAKTLLSTIEINNIKRKEENHANTK